MIVAVVIIEGFPIHFSIIVSGEPMNYVSRIDVHPIVMCRQCHHKSMRTEQHAVLELDLKASVLIHVYVIQVLDCRIHYSAGDYTE